MDLPTSIPWTELTKVTECRDVWCVYVSKSIITNITSRSPYTTTTTSIPTVTCTKRQNTHADSPTEKDISHVMPTKHSSDMCRSPIANASKSSSGSI